VHTRARVEEKKEKNKRTHCNASIQNRSTEREEELGREAHWRNVMYMLRAHGEAL